MLDAAPQDTRALVVGIDHYGYGDAWRLAGPAADALRCVDWLLKRGMAAQHIALFLSQASWDHDPAVAQWAATHPDIVHRQARRDAFSDYVDNSLPALGGSGLIVYWGGHGVIDDQPPKRNYLYTEDARDGVPYCVCVQDLMAALQGPRFAHLPQQVAIVDACANPFSDSGEAGKPAPASFAPPGKTDFGIQQTQMFAASQGQRAANITELKSGLFSRALFNMLGAHTAPGWPDFVQCFNAALDDVEALKLALQAPYLVISRPGGGERVSGKPPGASTQVEQLQGLVDATGVSPAVVYRLYLRSLADSTRRLEAGTIGQLLRDLANLPPRANDHPGPLVEFAERLAREQRVLPEHRQALADWVNTATRDAQNARTAMRDLLDTEARARRPRATLFVEIESEAASALHWWVQAPEPAHCSARRSVTLTAPLRDELPARLAEITADADRTVGHRYELVVSFILSDKLLPGALEWTRVAFDDDGLPGAPVPLTQRYPVTLHWQRRARASGDGGSRPVNIWRQALDTLSPRIAKGFGAKVVWLDSAAVDPLRSAQELLLDQKGQGICISLGAQADTAPDRPAEAIIACLRQGVPCFFWLATPPAPGADPRQALCDLFASETASDAPAAIGRRRIAAKPGDALQSLRMVWDEPGHLPPPLQLESPP